MTSIDVAALHRRALDSTRRFVLGIGRDPTREQSMLAGSGMFGSEQPAASEGPAQARLLGALGRKP